MKTTKIILAAAALLAAGLTAKAQMMFLAEENLGDLSAELPGSPVLYDIASVPQSFTQSKYEVTTDRKLLEVSTYKFAGGKVKSIETMDFSKGDTPSTTLTAFTYDKAGNLQMMSVEDKDAGRVLQEVTWRYNAAGKPVSAKSKTDISGYILERPGGKYTQVTDPRYLEYTIGADGVVSKVVSYHAQQYEPWSVSYRKGGSLERTGTNLKYALPGETRYRMSQHYKLPESSDGIMAAPDGTPVNYQREYSYTTEGWLMQTVTNVQSYTDKEGNEVEEQEIEINYQYETDDKGNWTRMTRISSVDPEKLFFYEREYVY